MTVRDSKQEYKYLAYGLCLSSNLPIVGLLPTSSTDPPDVLIKLGTLPNWHAPNTKQALRYASAYPSETGEPGLQIWDVDDGEFLRMLYSDGVEFWLGRELTTLWGNWPTDSTLQDTVTYLVGPILGLLLRLRGIVCLHASAVNINERAVVFVGPEGAGKSTTAGAFALLGYPVLSDDIVALLEREHEFRTFPAYPRVNLWPDSVAILYGSPDTLPAITPDWDKRCLQLGKAEGTNFEERPLPLGVIYVLGDGAGGPADGIELISQKTALIILVGNTYATNFLDAKQRAEEFAVLSRLVAAVPVRQINVRRDAVGPQELCRLVQRDFARIASLASSSDY